MITQGARHASLLRGKYLVKNIAINAILRCIDAILTCGRRFLGLRGTAAATTHPQRILISNGAALGDVVLATAVLPVLRACFPQAEFGMLVGSWSRMIVADHPLVRWVHVLDHWKINRSGASAPAKWIQYLRSRSVALKEIRQVGYDVGIDLYYFFPNAIILLWQARIPIRIGYTSAGFGPLLTHPTRWTMRDCSVVNYHADLIRRLGVPECYFSELQPCLIDGSAQLDQHRRVGVPSNTEYLVLHVGTGLARKEWPLEKWRSVAEALVQEGRTIVFTGAGSDEARKVSLIADKLPNCTNLCNSLDWRSFVSVISGAHVVVGVDSVVGHVAAAVGTPCVVISNGINNSTHWRPQSRDCVMLVHQVPCSPCYLKAGCAEMECVRLIEVEEVVLGVRRLSEARNQSVAAGGSAKGGAVEYDHIGVGTSHEASQ